MDSSKSEKPWFVRAIEWLYDGWNFAQFVGASGLGAWASYTRMEGNTLLAPWFLLVFAALSGLASVRIVRTVWNWLRVIIDRPGTVIEIETGTDKAMMEIGHFGAPLSYTAVGRILRSLDPALNPQPTRARFQCELQLAEGKPDSQRVTLRDGEWAHIVLADHIKSPQLNIRRGTYGRRLAVPDSGVEMEIVLTTHPRIGQDTIRRVIRVTRQGETIHAATVDS